MTPSNRFAEIRAAVLRICSEFRNHRYTFPNGMPLLSATSQMVFWVVAMVMAVIDGDGGGFGGAGGGDAVDLVVVATE